MEIKEIFKVSRKTFFNPVGWLGVDGLKTASKTIWDLVRNLFSPAKPEYTETFEEAMKRMNLSEADVHQTARTYFIYAICFGIIGLCSFIAAFYFLFVEGSLARWMLTIACTGLLWVQAFRYHFWMFQMKHRKLGCTFQEWRQGKLNDQQGPQV